MKPFTLSVTPRGRWRRGAAAAAWLALAAGTAPAAHAADGPACPAVLKRQALRLQDERPQDLCQYAGKVVLVVNTASFCGYTPQYQALETLHRRYQSRGFVVLGFPSNDFGAQEPGNNREIAAFCENTFGVKFPMFVKTRVVPGAGAAVDPLFADLRQRTGQAPAWNFHKYLISRDGQQVESFASETSPLEARLVTRIEKMLDQSAPK